MKSTFLVLFIFLMAVEISLTRQTHSKLVKLLKRVSFCLRSLLKVMCFFIKKKQCHYVSIAQHITKLYFTPQGLSCLSTQSCPREKFCLAFVSKCTGPRRKACYIDEHCPDEEICSIAVGYCLTKPSCRNTTPYSFCRKVCVCLCVCVTVEGTAQVTQNDFNRNRLPSQSNLAQLRLHCEASLKMILF